MNLAELQNLHKESIDAVGNAASADELEQLRIKYQGRNGIIPALMKQLKDVPTEERPAFGKAANAWRQEFESLIKDRASKLSETTEKATLPQFDATLPGRWPESGSIHPLNMIIDEVVRIFGKIGFTVADGPDIETKFNNFTALNTAPHHPSMDASDTLWITDDILLRTQTSPVQIREMLSRKPPIRILCPGRTYRRDTMDATHSANFHQFEGLYVDTKPVSLADLKATLSYFAKELMGPDVRIRFRPHFFPFTEPSVEMDFSCHVCGGKGCRVCKQSGWIELGGAGMIDPRVYRHVGYDPNEVYGFAFGFGMERTAMIKYGIPDIRFFYENDLRFLEQFK